MRRAIVIAAGGTAGHVVPALAARALPVRLGDAALRALGVQSSMRGFTGRR